MLAHFPLSLSPLFSSSVGVLAHFWFMRVFACACVASSLSLLVALLAVSLAFWLSSCRPLDSTCCTGVGTHTTSASSCSDCCLTQFSLLALLFARLFLFARLSLSLFSVSLPQSHCAHHTLTRSRQSRLEKESREREHERSAAQPNVYECV